MKYVITGVREGLGFEFAKLCLEEGIEVMGLSRFEPKLDVTHIQADFSDDALLNRAIEQLKKVESVYERILFIV